MTRAPGLRPLNSTQIFGYVRLHALNGEIILYFSPQAIRKCFLYIVFDLLAHDEHDLTKATANGIVQGIIYDGLAVGTELVELLDSTVAAADPGSQN